jgi:hypothetical protein
MGRSRYPRRGHRIAPAILKELLEVPVPTKYLPSPGGRILLCDLDESSWDRFGEETCRALAGEVLGAVGRTARMPLSIGDRRLPLLPAGMRLTDLDLENRTINCLVAAGIHERPQDLEALQIDGLLALRGFWVKCLLDLLTSLEYAIDHPDARGSLRKQLSHDIATPRIVEHYPKTGYRLAPETLRDILTDPLPSRLVHNTIFAGKQLCHLDERAWNELGRETIDKLAKAIIARVNLSGHTRALQQRRLPQLPRGVRLEDLRLENRTFNCLRREGFADAPAELAERTVGQLLSIRAFGAKCLVDLLTAAETLVAREGTLDKRLLGEARALAELPGAAGISFNDPRLGPLLRATDTRASRVGDLVRHIEEGQVGAPDPLRLHDQIRAVRHRIEQLQTLSLDEELIGIFSPCATGRDRRIVAEYYGWDGRGRRTLEQLGREYGLSRERIRQVCVGVTKRSGRAAVYAPVLDRTLDLIARRVPCSAETLSGDLGTAEAPGCKLPLESVLEAANFLGRCPRFELAAMGQSRLVVKPGESALVRAIVQAAKRLVFSYGAATIAEIASEIASNVREKADPALIETALSSMPEFRWLDRRRGWFQLESMPQYGLPNMIEKILSVCQRIDVHRLRAAVARYRRSGRTAPPARVLLEFCRQMPGIQIEGSTIVADPPRDWRSVLSGVEARMAGILHEHGPVLDRSVFEDYCIREGMNRFSFNAVIMCSPIIAQFGRSVYGLLGAKMNRRAVHALSMKRRWSGSARVLQEFGTTADGQAYLAYRLSKAAISGGVVTVPVALRSKLEGRFAIRTPDGGQCGTLVAKNGCAWGLGAVLRLGRAEAGDYLLLVFNIAQGEVIARIGGDEVLDSVALGHQPAM